MFPTSLIRPKTNVVTTLCFRPGINVTTTSWFWCFFPDKNLKVFQYHWFYFFKDMQYYLAIPMQSVHSNSGYLKICSSLPEQRKGIFDLVHSSGTAPYFLVVNSVGSWFHYFLRSGNQTRGYNTYMLWWSYKAILNSL